MSPMAGPIILLALPLVAAGATYLVRRWAILASFISALTSASLAFLCLRLPLDRSAFVLGQEVAFGRPVVILGRNLILDPAGQAWLAFIFVLATIFYLFAWRISQGRSFFSFSLVILSLYALVTLLHNFSLAIIVLAISTTMAVFIIQGGLRGSTRGAQRYLQVTLLAVPFLLTAAWLGDQFLLDPANAEMARLSLPPAALGFGLLLAVFPFGTWMPALSADAPPIVTAFVFTAGQAMALYMALTFLSNAPWALSHPATSTVILLAGLVMAFSGGVMAAVQRDLGRLFGYAALSDLGILLLAFSSIGSQGLTLTLLHMIHRSISIALMASSLSILRHRAGTDSFARLQGVVQRLPIAVFGLVLGGLALAGFPFTAGFSTHWATSRAILNWAQPFSTATQEVSTTGFDIASAERWIWFLTLLALVTSTAGIVIGLLRGLSAMLGATPREDIARQPIIASIMVLALSALTILLSLYPQFFLESVRTTAEAFSLF
jgi:formate hydrogenlyase subunit 3/multisubunit Na+/H+ antiporter MnhD subunit